MRAASHSRMNEAVPLDGMPPIETLRWYVAPPPGANGRSPEHDDVDERVRSHVRGAELVTVCPALRVTGMSLGWVWQSVDRHQTSDPLVTVNDWALVPTFIVQSRVPVFVSRIDSFGSSPRE